MAKKKKKNKITSFLKKAAPLLAAGLGAAALGRRKQNQTYLAEEGGDRSDMRNYGPFSNEPNYMPKRSMTFPAGDYSRIQDYMAKGGRVGCGVAKKGFGRALKKGRKK
jgi:hypothetical protein